LAEAAMGDIEAFTNRLLAVEEAWTELDRIEGLAAKDPTKAATAIDPETLLALESPQLLARAGDMLASWGHTARARDLLADGLKLEAPAAPLQLSYARRLRELGDLPGARAAYRAAMLRARPDAALLFEYAALEQRAGDAGAASAIAAIAPRFRVWNDAGLLAAGASLRAAGRPDLALQALLVAFRRGCRNSSLLADMLALREADPDLLTAPFVEEIAGGPTLVDAIEALAAHDKLAQAQDRGAIVAAAEAREAAPAFLGTSALHATLHAAIAARRPLSLIRLGDGEGRFLLGCRPELHGPLARNEAHSIAALMWSVWFGADISVETRLDEIMTALDVAIAEADMLGLPLADRLASDDANFGYLAVLEHNVAKLAPRTDRRLVDASCNIALDRIDPFLGRLLRGLDFLGLISPHPELGGRLQCHLGIGEVVSYDIPGEGRLGRPREVADRGQHFPAVYDRIMAELTVPRPGAVFLVAGGLLGKLYCARIRQLGGIAIDIGAIADAWMGINTRGPHLNDAARRALPA
jgi:hypothetical protein